MLLLLLALLALLANLSLTKGGATGHTRRIRVRRPPMGPWRGAAAAAARGVGAATAAARGPSSSASAAPHGPSASAAWRHSSGEPHPLEQCAERWRDATLDHFSRAAPAPGTFKQRYFVCDRHWRPRDPSPAIFFYAGNEADVLLYLNNTGLMCALLIFALAAALRLCSCSIARRSLRALFHSATLRLCLAAPPPPLLRFSTTTGLRTPRSLARCSSLRSTAITGSPSPSARQSATTWRG